MHVVNQSKPIKIKTKPTFESNPNPKPTLIEPMIFKIDDTTTTPISTAARAKTKKPSFISRQILIEPPSPPSSVNKRRPLRSHSSASFHGGRFAEVAGGTTAECAAICCCCPCGLANLLYLTIYKVPAGLCRRALRTRRRKQLIKEGLLSPRTKKRCRFGCDETEIMQISPASAGDGVCDGDAAMVELEKEMWERFYNSGFWRSPSQRETSKMAKVQPL